MSNESIRALFSDAITRRVLKKAVFSKAADKAVLREVVTLQKKKDGSLMLAAEKFTADNKTYRRNLAADDIGELCRMALEDYRQVNLLTTAGDAQIKRSKSDTITILGKLKPEAEAAAVSDGSKKYILDASRDVAFLRELGVADANGRIHDKKQAKFRQINRFLELIRDVEDRLPADRAPVICDLCCGKSYLTFAVYYYFTVLKKRPVRMWGVDLKRDVIEYCTDAAARCGFTALTFVSGDINEFTPPERPDMVISLHACDIATDIVLANAVKWGAGIILSTPCCHHEMTRQLAEPAPDASLRREMAFLLSHPMLTQKLVDAVTDALRYKRLEAEGYTVTTLELIDPEETPKNLMIRAILDPRCSEEKKAAALAEYRAVCRGFGLRPYLDGLLP